MTRPFTGWHMLWILVAMFGVIIAVNAIMARAAITTFGGTVVANSYVASQRFNTWLEAARVQERLGWTHAIALDAGRHIVVSLASPQGAISGAQLVAQATHPLGRTAAQSLVFEPVGGGRYRASTPLATGRWLIHLTAKRGSARAVFDGEITR